MNDATDMKNPAHLHSTIFTLFLLLFYLTEYGDAGGGIPDIELTMPPSHVALSGDLHVQIASSSFPPLLLQLSRLEGNLAQPLTTFPVYPEARALAKNSTIVKIPCGYFSRGGQYYVLVKKQPIGSKNTTKLSQQDESVIRRSLDVRWPMPQLSLTPENLQTYPEQPVMAILEFPEVVCPPVADSPASAIPEFWLELHYCGQSLLTCDNNVPSKLNGSVQGLYSEQVRGFPGRRVLTLRCELFGLAGHYALILRPTAPSLELPHTAAYVKVDWSEQFVFNVHARSIFPCDVHNGGVNVLFQYPSCILATGDRVRLFARLRANVISLAPPTSLEYVAEQRVVRGQHSLHFDCDLFTEKYIEYCFVYVSQAISGAVADVRMDCVPTLPVTEQESGGWGLWSPWTACSTTCIGGTRSRYRFCDSPPPRYGAKFCESKMAKGKGKKGKKKKAAVVDPNALTEVDKTFYELTITDLNRKLARLRSLTQELEQKNEELNTDKDKLDEDRSDIIAYLKRVLQEKIDEIAVLEETITALQETKKTEIDNLEEKIVEMNAEYTQMHEQLTSENKLLEGKLNSLEEFRSQRDDLMKKFESQENLMEAQEKRHKRELYEIERKFIISKDQLKKDMEARLLQLSTDFHDATELRIAATTHRVIRENITINNELDVLLTNQQRLYNENTNIKKKDTNLRQQCELLEEEKKQALGKVRVQLKIIARLTDDHKFMSNLIDKYKKYEAEVLNCRGDKKKLSDSILQLEHKTKLLEQNLHHVRCDRTSIQTDYLYLKEENDRLNEVLIEAVSCIKEALTVRTESDQSLKASKRENLLNSLFTLLNKAKNQKIRRPSLETVDTVLSTYTRGDLGFVPRPVEIRSVVPTKRNMESQTGASFDEYLDTGAIASAKMQFSEYGEEEEEESTQLGTEEEAVEEEQKSVLFYDETEMPGEDSGDSKEFDIFDNQGESETSQLSGSESEASSQEKSASESALRKQTLKKSLISAALSRDFTKSKSFAKTQKDDETSEEGSENSETDKK